MIYVEPATVTTIAGAHQSAADDLNALAGGVPTSVDGGLGTEPLAEMLTAVIRTAGDLATLNATCSALVAGAARLVGHSDGEIAEQFVELGAALR